MTIFGSSFCSVGLPPVFVDKGLVRPTKKKNEEMETDLEQASSFFFYFQSRKTPRQKQGTDVHVVQCSEECTDLNISVKKTPLNIVTSSKVTSSEQESAVHLPPKNKGHSFQVSNHPRPETEDI